MKKLTTLMLGMAFAVGTVTLFAADAPKTDTKTESTKTKKTKKAKTPKKSTDKSTAAPKM